MNCSIIIPTYNRLEYLKKCIKSLLKLDYENYEIIIIDDASTDGTWKYLNALENNKIKIFRNNENLGPSITRNNGVKIAKYDIIVFTDDDCLVDRMWLKNLVNRFFRNTKGAREKQEISFVFGQTYYIRKGYKGYFPERLVNIIGWPGGGNIAFRKDIFEKIGGFDDFYYYYNNEDSEIAIRAMANSFCCREALDAVVYHQAMNWTVKSLFNSAKNASVWPVLKKKYPYYYRFFHPSVRCGMFINIEDYFYILILPMLIPLLFIRYLYHGKRDIKIFFAKWPIYLFLRRYYIYKEAIKNRVFML